MIVLLQILKKTVLDMWDELLNMIFFNLIWLLGTVFIIFWPFVTFSLFHVVKDISEGRGIKFTKFFAYGRQTWKQAYVWGLINVIAYFVLLFNIRFYGGFGTQWALFLQILFLSLVVFWTIIQLMTVALYPRLEEPGFKLAIRNAAIIVGRNPGLAVVLLIEVALLLLLFRFVPVIMLVLGFSFIALLVNNTLHTILKKELAAQRTDTE